MVDDVLVDGGGGGHEHRHARPVAPAGPPDLLARGCDRARVAGEDRHIEAPDVDAELEGVRGHDAQDLAVAQPLLDRAALGREVAAAVAAHPRARPGVLAERLAQPGEDELHGRARAAEDDRLAPGPQEGEGPALGERQGGAPGAGRGVDHGRIDEQEVPLPGGGAAAVDDERGATGEERRQLAGVGDRGRAGDDDRVRAVVGAEAEEAPQHVGDVAAEEAAVGVELVDDDDLELLEQLEPLGVVGQDRGVEHVGVRDDHLAGRPDGRADRCRGVAVVRRSGDGQAGRGGQLAEGDHLVLAEGLGGEEPEGAGRRIVRQRLEDRQLVAEALPGRGGRHHADVAAGAHRVEGLRLVGVEGRDAALLQGPADPDVEPAGEGGGRRRAGGLDGMMEDAPRERRLVEDPGEHRLDLGGSIGAHRGRPPGENTRSKCGRV